MPDAAIAKLLAQAQLSFVGTVEQTGAATLSDLPVDERTAVVQVDQVLHAPEAFGRLAGSRITVQLAGDAQPPAAGETWAFFANGLAFGESIAVSEVGRLAVKEVQSHLDAAAAGKVSGPFAGIREGLERDRLRAHAEAADAVVLGRVVKLEKAVDTGFSEHDPDWWKATLDVHHVEHGDLQPGEVEVLYPNSLDVRWHRAPKLHAGQEGIWVLHATEGALREAAPYSVEAPEDYQSTQGLEALRGDGGAGGGAGADQGQGQGQGQGEGAGA